MTDWILMLREGNFHFRPGNFAYFPYHVATHGGRARPMDNRQSAGGCACGLGFMMVIMTGVFLSMVPNIPQEIYILLVVGLFTGFILLIAGVMVLRKSSGDARRVYEIVSESEEISLEDISQATGIPVSRVQVFIEWAIFAKQVKGRIIDGRYIQKLVAERIDSTTVRCPHCQAELELEEDF